MDVERRTFKKYTYRGIELKELVEMKQETLVELLSARQRRKMTRGLKHKYLRFLRKVRQALKDCPQGEKPKAVKSHLRNMIVLPEMVHSVIAIYNGKAFTSVEIKPDMVGHYLGEFAITYKPVKHGRPGIGATHSSRFIPLK